MGSQENSQQRYPCIGLPQNIEGPQDIQKCAPSLLHLQLVYDRLEDLLLQRATESKAGQIRRRCFDRTFEHSRSLSQ